jgi:hypothetical protein
MKLKIFTPRLNPATGVFDKGELTGFQSLFNRVLPSFPRHLSLQ